jgi:Rieske Fe-S protein
MTTDEPTPGLGRRHAIAGAAGLGMATPLLAACGEETPEGNPSVATDPTSEGTDGGGGGGGGGGDALAATSDVPVGGGTIFADEKVVVTQPAEGDFKAFTAVCTHQGCLVGSVEGEEILCPCHGSVFSVVDGSVLGGPAPSPLEEVAISVDGDQISLA